MTAVSFYIKSCVSLLLLMSFGSVTIIAQDENQFRYCLAFKSKFNSEGECSSGSNPKFKAFQIELLSSNQPIADNEIEITSVSELHSIKSFAVSFFGPGNFDIEPLALTFNESTDFSLGYDIWVTDILNDTHKEGSLLSGEDELFAGENGSYIFGSSDPCSNNYNWAGHRESYEISVNIIVDDPVQIKVADNSSAYRINADDGQLILSVNDFYNHTDAKPTLEVALDDASAVTDWIPVPYLTITPNVTLQLFYSHIVGGKTSSRYRDWLGKNLKFRVKKTLLNGEPTYSRIISPVRFDPPGPQFYIRQVTRSACESGVVNIFAKLTDVRDAWYMTNQSDLFKWAYCIKEKNSEKVSSIGTCLINADETDSTLFKVIPQDNLGRDPFLESYSSDEVFQLQLQDFGDNKRFFCTREFVIPQIPDSVRIRQSAAAFSINGDSFHLLNMNNPYAILNIDDSYEFADLRKPYIIKKEGAFVQEVGKEIPGMYEDLSDTEKISVDSFFMADYSKLFYYGSNYNDRRSPFGKYFDTRFNLWKALNKNSFLYSGNYVEPERSFFPGLSPYTRISNNGFSFFVNPIDSVFIRYVFSFEGSIPWFYWGATTTGMGNFDYFVDEYGQLVKWSFRGSTILPIEQDITLIILDYNSNVLITLDPEGDNNPFYWVTFNSDGTINKKLITNSGKNIRLSSDGKFCFYSLASGSGLYAFDGKKSVCLNNQIIEEIVGVDVENKYCIFKDGNNDLYAQIYDFDYYYNDFPGSLYFSDWQSDYKADYWNKWVQERYGYRLYGVKPNVVESYVLEDQDGCEYPFNVEVRIPESPKLDSEITKLPSSFCAFDGNAVITYLGGGNAPYYHGLDTLAEPNDKILISNLHYGSANVISFYNSLGELSFEYEISLPNPVSVECNVKHVTCNIVGVNNGEIELIVDYNDIVASDVCYQLIEASSRRETNIVKSGEDNLYHLFDGLDAGSYDLIITIDGCEVFSNTVTVKDQLFAFDNKVFDAERFDSDGKVAFSFVNRSGQVSWDKNAPLSFVPVSADYYEFENVIPGSYSFNVVHNDEYERKCYLPVAIDVDQPYFSAAIDLDMNNEGASDLEVSLTELNSIANSGARLILLKDNRVIDSKYISIKDGVFGFSESDLEDGKYVIRFSFDDDQVDICNFSLPAPIISYDYVVDSAKCPGDSSVFYFSDLKGGFSAGDYSIGQNGLNFYDTDKLTFSGDQALFYVKNSVFEESFVSNNKIAISKSIINMEEKALTVPSLVSAHPRSFNVSCHGLNNGQISILNPSGGSGSYAWRLGNSDVWMDTAQVAENLQPGNYDVYIKDDVNNCPEVNVGSVTLEEPDEMVVADSSRVAPVCSDGKGSVSMSVSGGNAWYSFVLKNDSTELDAYPMEEFTDETSVTFDSLVAGEYLLTATDPMGCAVDAQFVMEPYDNPVIDGVSVEPVVCNGESNGSMEVLNTTGTADPDSLFLFDLKTHELGRLKCPDQKFEALSAGTYRLLLHDVNGCVSDTVQRVVYQPDSLRLEIDTIRSVIGKGTDSGYILSRVTGGNTAQAMTALLTPLNGSSPTVRQLSVSEQIPFVFTSLKAGAYQVEVNDYKACSVTSAPIEVFEPDEALRVEVIDVQNALCKAAIGSFTIQGAGGWGDYVYRRATDNGLAPIKTFNRLSAGAYKVFVEDALGASSDTTIVITEPDLLTVEESEVVLPTCNDNGVLEVAVDGGMYPYNLVFMGDADTTKMTIPGLYSFGNRSVGGYQLAAIDNNGCRAVVESSLSDSLLLSIQEIESGVPSKPGSTDGWMHVKVKGGREPLSYEWRCLTENGRILTADSATVLNIPSGYYQVSVQEAGGCTVSRKQYLHDVSDGLLSITAIGHETSWQANDGYASFSSAVLDITRVEVYYPNNVVVQYTGNEDPDHFNINDAAFTLTNLTGGEYLVFAYSDAGVEVAKFEIDSYEAFRFLNIEVKDVVARGDTSGVIDVWVEGGAPDYVFQWEALDGSLENAGYVNYFNKSSVEGVPAGSYHVAVTDIYDNLIETVVDVAEPSARLNIVVSDITNQSCRDSVDAYVEVEASGGWGDYQFSYANKDNYQDLNRWDGLPVGRHWVYTIDEKGGVDSIFVIIAEPPYLRASQVLVDSAKCYNDASGKVLFDIEGGTGPYRFALVDDPLVWKNTTVTADAGDGPRDYFVDDQLPEGHRIYRFTDANNCQSLDTLTVYIPQPDELLLSFTDVVHTTCNTDNGSIEVGLKGGTLPYRYEWIDNSGNVISTAPSVSGLRQQGFYSLDVWDKYNCHLQFEQTIKPSTRPVITGVEANPVLCYGDSNGSASITGVVAAEPYAPYRFYWSDSQTGDSVSGLAAGRYYVTIRDTNLCETTRFFDISTPDTLGLSLLQLRNAHCFGYNDGFIEVKPLGGVGNYTYLWSNGDTTNRAVNLVKGDYHLIFTDGNKCAFEQSFFIDEPPMATVNVGDDFTMCPGNSVVIDGRDFASHQWQRNGDIISDERYITVSDEGNYFLRVTNDIGCFAYDTITVAIGNDALQADFLMTAEAFIGDTLMLFELSNLPLDSLSWSFQSTAFVNETPVGVDDYILHLKTLQEGMFNVSLYAYSGGCFSKRMKQVEVQNGEYDLEGDDLLGYSDPLIESFIVSPNPSSGLFNVKVTLREAAEIQLSVFSISEGTKLEERTSSGLKVYAEPFVLNNVNTGVYVVILTAGNERRQVKIVIE